MTCYERLRKHISDMETFTHVKDYFDAQSNKNVKNEQKNKHGKGGF